MTERRAGSAAPWLALAVALALPGGSFGQVEDRPGLPASFVHDGGEFLAGAPEKVILFPNHPELEGRYSEASIIRMAYAALERAILDSGHGVSFEVSDVRTYYRRDFETVLLLDVLTLDAPMRLEITDTEVNGGDGASVGRAFVPRWIPAFTMEDLDQLDEWLAQFEDSTLARVLAEAADDETRRKLIAVTSFAVRATFDGDTREYRAIFKWLREERGAVSFLVEDHVTDAVERALVADQRMAPVSVLVERARQKTEQQAGRPVAGGDQ